MYAFHVNVKTGQSVIVLRFAVKLADLHARLWDQRFQRIRGWAWVRNFAASQSTVTEVSTQVFR